MKDKPKPPKLTEEEQRARDVSGVITRYGTVFVLRTMAQQCLAASTQEKDEEQRLQLRKYSALIDKCYRDCRQILEDNERKRSTWEEVLADPRMIFIQ